MTSMPGGDVEKARLRDNVGGNHNWMGTWVQVGKKVTKAHGYLRLISCLGDTTSR